MMLDYFNGLDFFTKYLIIVNIIGFVSFIISMLLYTYTEDKQIDVLLTIISLLGGSAGIVLSILLFDRKLSKDVMMSRVFVLCVFIVQLIAVLYFKGFHGDELKLNFLSFFKEHRFLIIYLVVINFITVIAFAMDKIAAIEHRWRIRIVVLLGLALGGGSIGALIGMYFFRHKINMDYFTVGVPLIIIAQIATIFYVMNL